DLGFDIGMENGFLQLSVDFYGQKTTDLLQNITLPVAGGSISRAFTFNAGALNSNGLELSLTNCLFKQNPDFSIENRFTLGRARTWLMTLDSEYEDFPDKRLIGDNSNGPGRWFPAIYLRDNKPVGEFWGYMYQGINADGEWIFKDIDGGGFSSSEGDFDYIGNALPRSLWSWNSSIQWKNVSLDFQLTGVAGHSILNTYRYFYEIPYSMGVNNILRSATERPVSRLREFGQLSDFYVEKASYARMDYMTLSYAWTSSDKWYSNLKVYLLSQNLFTITGYRGVDPEARLNSQGNPLVPGIELRNTYFPVRNWVAGVRINL
ncbi:MAG: TonB-dependent receptor, partial [Bacteroidetes bacterium]|nr:TonB-dependent receptor [Bacteroidota bacterium]